MWRIRQAAVVLQDLILKEHWTAVVGEQAHIYLFIDHPGTGPGSGSGPEKRDVTPGEAVRCR